MFVFSLAVAMVLFWGSTVELAWSYGELSHGQTVRDAFRYVVETAEGAAVRYPDGSTNRTDLDSLQRMFFGRVPPRPDAQALVEARNTLVDASQATDANDDVVLQGRTYTGFFEGSRWGQIAFTTFGHFINVATPGTFWDRDGYHYPWVRKNPRCSVPNPSYDYHVNVVIGLLPARVETNKSRALREYKLSARADIKEHFEKLDVTDVVFWPISLIGEHSFRAFLASPAKANVPTTLWHLGPALHAVEDATVPYHAIGVSGCGHVRYEGNIDDTYGHGVNWYDAAKIKNLLLTQNFLRREKSIPELIQEVANEASNRCALKRDGWECKIWDDESVARDMVNLAIAANVIALRKAAYEWNRARSGSSRSSTAGSIERLRAWLWSPADAQAQEGADRDALALLKSGRSATGLSFLERVGLAGRGLNSVREVEPDVGELRGPAQGVRTARENIQGALVRARNGIDAFWRRDIKETTMVDLFDEEVLRLGDMFGQRPDVTWNPARQGFSKEIVPGHPPLLSSGPRFRSPTKTELGQREALTEYRRQREVFEQSLILLDTFRLRAGLESVLRNMPTGDELAAGRRHAAQLRQYHLDLLQQAQASNR